MIGKKCHFLCSLNQRHGLRSFWGPFETLRETLLAKFSKGSMTFSLLKNNKKSGQAWTTHPKIFGWCLNQLSVYFF